MSPENATDIIFSVDLEGKVRSINPAGLRIGGYALEDVLGNPFTHFIAEENIELANKMMQRKLNGDVSSTVYEVRILTKDGRRLPFEISTSLIVESGKPIGVQGIARDVSERHQLLEQLVQAKQDELIGRLAGGVAHDFNNLLTVILGRSEVLRGQFTSNHPVRREIDFIREAAERAAVITRQLLDFSRRRVPKPVVLNLNILITNMTNWLQHFLGEHIKLTSSLAPDLRAVQADPVQMEQVILNLALNARDAMPKGGSFSISTNNEQEAYVQLSFTDTGSGMDQATLSHIFEPFYTTKGGRGFGLGLPIVQKLVALAGGFMEAESQPGFGTTFRIHLSSVAQRPDHDSPPPPMTRGGTEMILVVDDEPAIVSLVSENLESEGYTVLRAGSAEEAIRLYEENFGVLNLVLADVVLPGMSGVEFAEYLVSVNPGLSVLHMSGYPDEVIRHHGISQGSINLIEKPFTRTELVFKVREILDAARVSR